MSDWMATHSGAPAIEAGLDMDMPGGLQFTEASSEHSFFGGNITAAVNNGSLSIDRVDDMCRRVMTPYFYLGQSNYPPIDGSEYAENFWSGAYTIIQGLTLQSQGKRANILRRGRRSI